jgi:nicotinamide riboside kinase
MLISFSGAQSTGKTTLLNHIQSLNNHIKFVPEITRLIKRDYNLPINEDGSDLTQMLIISEHLRNAYKADISDNHYILDRCSLDGLVYTYWLCCKQKVNMNVYSMAYSVYEKTINKYDIIFYTSPDDVKLTDDGERSTDSKFRDEIIDQFNQYIDTLDNVIILRGTVKERLQIIKDTLLKKGLEIYI